MLKKWTRVFAVALIVALGLAGCAKPNEQPEEAMIDHKTIYASFFPIYALTGPLMTDVPNMQLKCLVQPQDSCLRNYQLSDWDYTRLANADAIIMGGRGLESFESTLASFGENGPARVSAMDGLTLIGQGIAQQDEMESHLDGENPWLFLSLDGAMQMSDSISNALIAMDPGYEELYERNLERQQQALANLQQQMHQLMVDADPKPVALLHEGLPYLADELGLNVVCRINREPGTLFYDADLKEALEQMEKSGAQVALLEKQAPDQLKSDLLHAGYQIALIDTLSTFSLDAQQDVYQKVMLDNAKAVASAFDAAT